MSETLLVVKGLRKSFGGVLANDIESLAIHLGETHAIIGPNGAGKTTLISQLAGESFPDSGDILYQKRSITKLSPARRARLGIGRSFQITSILFDLSVLDNVLLAVQAQCGHAYHFWGDAYVDQDSIKCAQMYIRQIGLDNRVSSLARTLSHGEQRQLEIAVALAAGPRLLLLDEPMAGMGLRESEHMLSLLGQLKSHVTVLLVEHDMGTVFAIADRISVLVEGRVIATGTPEEIRTNRQVEEAYLGESQKC